MRPKLLFISILLSLLYNLSLEAQTTFRAVLSSQQEVHPVTSKAFGVIEAILDDNMLMVSGEFGDLRGEFATEIAGGAHIHLGLAGSNGDVSVILNAQVSSDGRFGVFNIQDNTYELTSDQIMALESRRMYVNIHSTMFPDGEIRGQLLPDADFLGQALLTGHQEVPSVLTTGMGKVMVELNGSELVISGSFANLTTPFDPEIAGGAHIHLGSVGQNGGVAIILNANIAGDGLSGRFEPENNTFFLDEEIVNRILRRETYINIHTTGFPPGEIRGQITALSTQVFRSYLSGAQEKPFVDTRGDGSVLVEYLQIDSSLTVFGSFADLDFPVDTDIAGGAHIHNGMTGRNGAVAQLLDIDLSEDNKSGMFLPGPNTLKLSASEIDRLFNRGFYINIHSSGHPTGELRGQILPLAQYHFYAYLGGSQEFPSVVSTGNGGVMVEWSGEEITVSGAFSDLTSAFDPNIAGGAHIHFGLPGQNGGIALMLNTTVQDMNMAGVFNAEENIFKIDMDVWESLQGRGLYVNIHTTDFPSGEIRGQILHEAQAYYQSSLSGSQEVPSVITTGRGAVMMERRGSSLFPIGSFSNLMSAFDAEIAGGAHIHIGYAGRNGGVLAGLTPNLSSNNLSGVFLPDDIIELDEESYIMLAERELYVNIHTQDVPSGEIRGQITGQQVALFRAYLSSTNEVPEVETNGHGSVLTELLNDNVIISSGSFNDLDSPIDTDIAGGIHVHNGFAGSNGPVAVLLNFGETDGKNGVFFASENRMSIDEEAMVNFINRATYVNVHTIANQAGEIRGQLNGDANYVFTANLSGAQEVPSVTSPGFGALKIEWNGDHILSSGSVNSLWSEIDESIAGGAHIHMGMPGQNGDVALMLNFEKQEDSGNGAVFMPSKNMSSVDEEQAKMIADRGMYVNIHTDRYPAGEVRGQILREARAYYRANLYGSHEVPSVMTTGIGAVQIEWTGSDAILFGSFSNLMGSFDASIAGGAHIHTGLPGQNGPVLIGINPSLDDDLKGGVFAAENNTLETDEDFVNLIRSRDLYINIHTDSFPPGEIRGQIVGQSQAILRAYLAGSNEVPNVISNGQGVVQAEYRSDGSIVMYGAFDSLDGMVDESIAGGAHIHAGFPGRNGDILFHLDLSLENGGREGFFKKQLIDLESQDNAVLTLLRGTYVNIHTTEFAPGEIRGQLMGESQYEFSGILSGMQEVNPVLTIGNGAVKAEWSGSTVTLIGSVQNLFADIDLDIAGGVHLHKGLAGSNGPVVGMVHPEF